MFVLSFIWSYVNYPNIQVVDFKVGLKVDFDLKKYLNEIDQLLSLDISSKFREFCRRYMFFTGKKILLVELIIHKNIQFMQSFWLLKK